jgi:hypothetical protein
MNSRKSRHFTTLGGLSASSVVADRVHSCERRGLGEGALRPRSRQGSRANRWALSCEELDELLKGPIELRCPGGLVVTQQYGVGRETSDIDFLAVIAQSPEHSMDNTWGRTIPSPAAML